MSRTLPAVALALLLVLAGCNGFLGGPGTPTATDGRDGTTTAPAYPPGFADGGLTEPAVLVRAHEHALKNASYTFGRSERIRYANGTAVLRENATARYGADHARYRYVHEVTARDGLNVFLGTDSGRLETWSNGSVTVSVVHVGNETDYRRGSRAFSARSVTLGDRVYLLLAATTPHVAGRTTVGGERAVVLRAGPVPHPGDVASAPLPGGVTNVTDVSFRAVVLPSGVVRSYRLSYAATWNGSRVRVVETASFATLGATTVARPAWVDEALNRTRALGRSR